jgi:hypothetical protein
MIMNSSFDECISECLRCALACEGCVSLPARAGRKNDG